MDFENAMGALRDGRLTFDEFARETGQRWSSTARWLMRRWRLPGWVEESDLVQELLTEAWRATWRYDAGRGSMPLERYVRVAAIAEVTKTIHKRRGADRHTRKGPSRIDRPFSTFGEEAGVVVDALGAVPAAQEDELEEARERRRVLDLCETLEELLAIQALSLTESLHGGACVLWDDEETRELLQLRSAEHASKVMVRAVVAFADRVRPGWREQTAA